MKGHLLIVEDDHALRHVLRLHFEGQNYRIEEASCCAEALAILASTRPDLVLLDQQLPDGTGLDLLDTIRGREPDLPVVLMTGLYDLELAIQAIQHGAHDFINKPIQMPALEHTITRTLEHQRLARQVDALGAEDRTPVNLNDMLGQSRAMVEVSKEIALVAASEVRVLITGESGTGKELVARAIHAHSHRAGPFLAVNCAALVDTLLESELFGHEKGAFTGAAARKPGKFELATDGTLFLDEIGELDPGLQAKLLRVLQEQTFERVGGTQQLHTQARVITATNRDLAQEVSQGNFREDLRYRLDVVHIHIPPLRERRDDIPLLSQGLMKRLAHTMHRKPLHLTDEALRVLYDYPWPGNVRELENVLTQALVRARDRLLTPDLLGLQKPTASDSPAVTTDPFCDEHGQLLTLDALEAHHAQRVLEATGGHKGQACDILGISRPALERKIQKYALQVPNARD